MKLECPFCHQTAMPAWRKLALGILGHVKCWNCGLRVTVSPGKGLVALLPSLVLIAWVVLTQPRDPASTIALAVLAFLATCLLQLFYAPLIRNQVNPAAFIRMWEKMKEEEAKASDQTDKPDSADRP